MFDRGLYFFFLIMTSTLSDLGFILSLPISVDIFQFPLVWQIFFSRCWTCQQKQYLCSLVQKLCMSSEKHWQTQDLFIICSHLRLFHFCKENSLVQVLNCAPNMQRKTQKEDFTLSMNWIDAGVRGWEWSDKAAGSVLVSTAAHCWKDPEYLDGPF